MQSFVNSLGALRASILGPLLAAGMSLLSGCSSASTPNEDVGTLNQAYGHYDLRSSYKGNIADTRGWIIEWRVPELLNPTEAVGVIGQWYYNLESGIYYTDHKWYVYYFGDDNGIEGNEPACSNIWGSGGVCEPLGEFLPGQQVAFKYEWCTDQHVPDVNGSQLCLSVDLKNGQGFRFLAADARTTEEMYAHDIEHFTSDGLPKPQISCSSPTKMVRQQLKNSSGSWLNMTGANTWDFYQFRPYAYQNLQLTSASASWESCSPAPDGNGNGLRGEYFDTTDLTGPSVVRTDGHVDFEWQDGSPDPSISSDTFSARWTGQIQPRYSETYTISTVSDDGVRLWLNGTQLIDNWSPHSPTQDSATITLQAGQKYDIRMEYFEESGGATAQLYWSSPSQPREIVPQGHLFSAASCVPESNTAFCARLAKNCGSVSGTDNCGAARSASSCGTCTAPATCGGGGTANVCGAPSGGSCNGVSPWDPNKPWYEYSVGERHVGSNNRLYECRTPNFCYLDPAGAWSSYGWANIGPC